MRVYIPATLDDLDAAVVSPAATLWHVPAGYAHAVTGALGAHLPGEDDEGLEWYAFLAAAHDSLAAVVAGQAQPLRVVVTVDIPDAAIDVAPGGEPSQIRLTRDLPETPILAVHVDEPDAADDVRAVRTYARSTEDDAEAKLDEAVQRVTDRDLLWYAPSEVGDIPRLRGG
jgi:hypothetical protein